MTLFLLVPAASASAAPEVGIADDRIMLTGGAEADEAVAEWKSLGIDNVRIIAHWGLIAPGTTARRAPAGFDADDPNEPLYRWDQLDRAVARVRQAGMSVTLLVTGPGPLWSSSVPGKRIRAYKPRPAAYAAYAEAVARRYGSAVDRYLLWNEPNLNRWLAPQSRCKRGKCTPVSPHIYRGLVRAGYKAIDDHDPGAEIVVGSLGPRGKVLRRWSSTMAPQLFLRRFGCRTDAYKRIRTAECRRFTRATLDGFAVHPYSFRAPEVPNPGRDDVSIAQLPKLISTLDRLKRLRALRSTTRQIGVFVDEFGYQTRPQDPFAGVSTSQQDTYLQRAAYHTWRLRRVKLLTQYLWEDEPDRATWQSGLRTFSGRAKRSLAHFDTPFVVDSVRRRMWGQVRPGGRQTVRVEYRRAGSTRWRRLASKRTDARGYWSLSRRPTRGTLYRFRVGTRVSQTLRG